MQFQLGVAPVSSSLALVPLFAVFVCLRLLRWKEHWGLPAGELSWMLPVFK